MCKKILFIVLFIYSLTDLSSQKVEDVLISSKVYDVGYTSKIFTDYSRTYNSINRLLGKQDSVISYRTITASIWYPAETKDGNKKMLFSNYLLTTELNDKKDYKIGDSINTLIDKFQDYYGLNDKVFSKIKSTQTNCYPNSVFLSGKFPLVIYIQGMNSFSFENHLLCETMASKGYVVISFNSKGSNSRWMEPLTIDFENQIRDIQFIIGESIKISSIKCNEVVLIGHSIGGFVNVLTKIRDNRISGLVSLDGSIKHSFIRVNDFVYNDISKINCPFLSFSNQNIGDANKYLDSLSFADRYYFQMSNFGHSDYKSITYLKKTNPDSVKFNNYLLINNLISAFIDKVHKIDTKFDEQCAEFSKNESINYFYKPSIPDIEYFMEQAGMHEFKGLLNIYNDIKKKYPTYKIAADDAYKWANSLRYYGHLDYSIKTYRFLINLYPNFMSAYNGLARTYLLLDNKQEAIKAYKLALKIEPDNESFKRKLDRISSNHTF